MKPLRVPPPIRVFASISIAVTAAVAHLLNGTAVASTAPLPAALALAAKSDDWVSWSCVFRLLAVALRYGTQQSMMAAAHHPLDSALVIAWIIDVKKLQKKLIDALKARRRSSKDEVGDLRDDDDRPS